MASHHIGCVSFLNSKPLIDPIVGREDVAIHFAVPSQLTALVEEGTVSAGLLSAVDYQVCARELVLVPAGMIGCDGPTLTVRLFSRVPPERIQAVYGDTDSHTSVLLAQVILRQAYGVAPPLIPLANAGSRGGAAGRPETMLLIGDKVVNAAPDADEYPFQLDLGEQWKLLTGKPFVFAMWMMRKDRQSAELARILADARRRGAEMTEELLDRHCAEHGWPRDLARRYFTEYLRYEVTARDRAGLALFFETAGKLGLLDVRRPLEYLEVG